MPLQSSPSSYDRWDAEARVAQAGPVERYSRGDMRTYIGDQIKLTINLGYGPLPIVFSREEAAELGDALRRFINRTAPPPIEE
jgi:hypothetical protein